MGGIGIIIILPFLATIISLKNMRGAALPLWLILIWVIPIAGSLLAIFVALQEKNRNRGVIER